MVMRNIGEKNSRLTLISRSYNCRLFIAPKAVNALMCVSYSTNAYGSLLISRIILQL